MTKLITETPDHPIPFLIDHLQTKQDSPGKLHRAFSGSAALWAQSSPGWCTHTCKHIIHMLHVPCLSLGPGRTKLPVYPAKKKKKSLIYLPLIHFSKNVSCALLSFMVAVDTHKKNKVFAFVHSTPSS